MNMRDQNWVEVHDMYFGNATWPSSVRYRVADDGEVQRQVEISLSFEENVLNETTGASSVQSSNIRDAQLEGLHDIRTVLHIVAGAVRNIWLQGWIELDEEGVNNFAEDKKFAMGGGTIIPWPEYIVTGESKVV